MPCDGYGWQLKASYNGLYLFQEILTRQNLGKALLAFFDQMKCSHS